ncbi:MAG: hypothetical protein M2R45_03896 [Verrucomicrobia subdivision 3 bacterium]|nr:hypothetical protein [Limisphaerales bacterium]MCS1412599.1 hypothetical protein [Limisphaerales bacterium]
MRCGFLRIRSPGRDSKEWLDQAIAALKQGLQALPMGELPPLDLRVRRLLAQCMGSPADDSLWLGFEL